MLDKISKYFKSKTTGPLAEVEQPPVQASALQPKPRKPRAKKVEVAEPKPRAPRKPRKSKDKPYLQVTISLREDGDVGIDADFNKKAILMIDEQYRVAGNPDYNPTRSDNEKIALFIADITAGLAAPLQPPDEELVADPYADIPGMAVRGGQEVKQTVDLAKRAYPGRRSVDFAGG